MTKLTCKSCGAKLELTDDIDRFSCAHCGNEWIVNRSGGIVSLKAVEEGLKKIVNHTEATAENTEIIADEIRMKRIIEKIEKLESKKKLISLFPTKKNPDFESDMKKYIEKSNNPGPKIVIGIVLLIIGGIIGFLFYPSI